MASGETAGKLELELRRGVVVLAVLSRLRTAQYGYSLRNALAEMGMPIEEGTLYPLIRRLESQGLLASEWRIEGARPRRYYRLNPEGAALYASLKQSWQKLCSVMQRLLNEEEN
jgi:PadR family transcriptional regulator, regulatory protein PadR